MNMDGFHPAYFLLAFLFKKLISGGFSLVEACFVREVAIEFQTCLSKDLNL